MLMRDWNASEDGGFMLVDEAIVVWLDFSLVGVGRGEEDMKWFVVGKKDARDGIGPHFREEMGFRLVMLKIMHGLFSLAFGLRRV
jgi:hypothetical protein